MNQSEAASLFPSIPYTHTHTHRQIRTLLNPHRRTRTHIQPSAIYNSWHDPVAPLREELREFKSWPNYAPLRFAPSALCSQKVERMATACTQLPTHTHTLCFQNRRPASELTPLLLWKVYTHTHAHMHTHTFATLSFNVCHSARVTHTHTYTQISRVNLHFSLSETQRLLGVHKVWIQMLEGKEAKK